jgi:hypothetical protein
MGHQAEERPLAHHSTNSFIPLGLPVKTLVEESRSMYAAAE